MGKSRKGGSVPTGGVIFYLDINRFGRDEIADDDRVELREQLQSMVEDVLSSLELSPTQIGDIGDGIIALFPHRDTHGDINKGDFITKVIPALTDRLIRYNRRSKDFVALRLRAVLHFGEYITHKSILTGKGAAAQEIILASRLLDSDFLRSWIRNCEKEKPLCLLISDKFYREIVKQQLPEIEDRFTIQEIETKDRNLVAWAFDFTEPKSIEKIHSPPKSIEKIHSPEISSRKEKKPLDLNELSGRCIFLSTADIYNYDLYKRSAKSVPLENHLGTALLLGDKVILHSVDPYRSKEVFGLLFKYRDFIEDGAIIFLLGGDVDDVRTDYEPYLRRKAREYRKSEYGEDDIEFLTANLEDKEFLKDVIDLLDMSPIKLHRGFGGTEQFVNFVKKDFEQAETIATYGHLLTSKIRRLNLSLYQLLHLKEARGTDKLTPIFGNNKKIDDVITELPTKIDSDSFSTQILMNLFKKLLAPDISISYYDLIEIRVNILLLRIHVGSHSLIEIHPERDKNSPYYYGYLLRHLDALSSRASRRNCGIRLVKKLRNHDSWRNFANSHLSVMSELYSKRLADLPEHPENPFHKTRKVKESSDIAALLR